MIFPKDKGFKHEAYGAGDVQALLKAQEVRDQKHDEEELEEIITDLNELSVKYGGIGTATTYSEAMENLEETIQGQISTLVEKSITENGTYNAADDNADGYSEVTVDVVGDNNAKFITSSLTSFSMRNLIKVIIPEGITSIGTEAFRYGLIEEIVFPSTLVGIFSNAFYGCGQLESIELPDSVTTIASDAFSNCTNLKSVKLSNNLNSISGYAFNNCAFTSIEIPASVTSIEAGAFSNCNNLETITIDKSEGSISGAPWGAPETCQVIWAG